MSITSVPDRGPLKGLRVVELAGIGPAPFACMLLADLGADVLRVDRTDRTRGDDQPDDSAQAARDVLARGRRSVALDLKDPRGVGVLLDLVARADVCVEGFRPGVAERLGFGPGTCRRRNRRLVYGRMTGWGQDGPWAPRAGHDLNYIALAGALHPIGPPGQPPTVPINYVGDFGGGGMLLVVGVLAALWERERSGQGQVVDAAMVDGAAAMSAFLHGLLAMGQWRDERGVNLLDGTAPYYRTYRCADERYVAVAALEPQFYAELLAGLELDPRDWPQHDRSRWPAQVRLLERLFATRSRESWMETFEGTDACVAPVLSLTEAGDHPHLAARDTFAAPCGVRQPAPAPRFGRTPPRLRWPPPAPGEHTDEILREAGLEPHRIAELRAAGVVA